MKKSPNFVDIQNSFRFDEIFLSKFKVPILSRAKTKIDFFFFILAPAAGGILQTDRAPASMAPNRFPNRDTPTIVRRPILKKKIPFNEEMRPIRRKPGFRPLDETSNPDPRFPIKNEIPDSANVRANQGPRADVPPVSAVQNERDFLGANQLNLGKNIFFLLKIVLIYFDFYCTGGIIALGVFGGFVFLAAIITTVVILIRR